MTKKPVAEDKRPSAWFLAANFDCYLTNGHSNIHIERTYWNRGENQQQLSGDRTTTELLAIHYSRMFLDSDCVAWSVLGVGL